MKAVSVSIGPKPDVPIACTLQPGEVPDRVAEWKSVLGAARARVATEDGGLRIELQDDVALDHLARLVAAEQQCCAFFSFAITVDGRGSALEVRAPEGAEAVVESLFGRADDQ